VGKPERQQRERRALQLIDGPKVKDGVIPLLMAEFDCSERTAQYAVHHARTLMAKRLAKHADRARIRIIAQIEAVIYDNPTTVPLHLAAISKVIDLLGVAAPQRIQAEVTAMPPDPLTAYQGDLDLRDRALQLERDIADGNAAHTGDTGAVGNPRLDVPAPPASSGNGRDAGANGNGQK